MKKILFAIFLFAAFCAFTQQQPAQDETKAEVPALSRFHTPIYQLWHDAWPNKNLALFKSLVSDLDAKYAELAMATLPGILRDKKETWDAKVKELGATVDEYKKLGQGNDTAAILAVAEKLHAQYEGLVRTIRPAIKALDYYHQILYMLYHYYLPEYSTEKIESSIAELAVRMDTLMAAKLPERLKAKEDAFIKSREELKKSLTELAVAVKEKKGRAVIEAAIKKMHSQYEKLESIFK